MFVSAAARLSLGLAVLSSVASKVIDIQVGDANGSTVYTPEAVVRLFSILSQPPKSANARLQFADVGDQVVFTFHQKNHTVTQSSLAAPCSLEDGGLDSGLCVSFSV